MRKIYLSLIMILCLAMTAQAQRTTAFGLKAGVNFATVDGKDFSNDGFRLGYHVGGMVNVPLVLGVSIQPEFLVSLKGAGEADGSSDNLSLLYIEIPLMAKVMLGEKFNLQFGPYGGFLINAGRGDLDLKSTYKSFDTGVGLGLGYIFGDRITFDARYMYGLSKVRDDVNFDAGNRVVQLSLGFLLGGNR